MKHSLPVTAIRHKLYLSLLMMNLFVICIGVFSLISFSSAEKSLDYVGGNVQQVLRLVTRLEELNDYFVLSASEMLLSTEENELEGEYEGVEQILGRQESVLEELGMFSKGGIVDNDLLAMRRHLAFFRGEIGTLKGLVLQKIKVDEQADMVGDNTAKIQMERRVEQKMEHLYRLGQDVQKEIKQLVDNVEFRASEVTGNALGLIHVNWYTILSVVIVCVLFSLFISIYVVHGSIVVRLERLLKYMLLLAEGNYKLVMKERISKDEIGQMAKALFTFRERLIENDLLTHDLQYEITRSNQLQIEAEKANQTKSDFLASMSHELRTPLNSIMGLSQMLKEDIENPRQKELARIVYRSSINLLDTVNDILDLSKIEAHQMVLEQTGFDFKDILHDVTEFLYPMAESKGISLNCNMLNENLPCLIGDPVRLTRILTNLMGNAIKYTDEGWVEVLVDFKDCGVEEIELYCGVQDTGIGIPEEKHEIIFQKFTQAEDSITRRFGGTGLGLSITQELVTLMGGEIGLESEPGQGSLFWFKIRFPVMDALVESDDYEFEDESMFIPPLERINVHEACVLVVEDHKLNIVLVEALLAKMGLSCYVVAMDGEQALRLCRENKFDLILMDCHLPNMSGYDVTMAVRHGGEMGPSYMTDKNVPIIALTADAMVGTRKKCLDAGMNDYVSKPIDVESLRAAISRWIDLEGVSVEKAGAALSSDEVSEIVNISDESGRPYFDVEVLKHFASDKETLQRYSRIFYMTTEELFENLEEQGLDCGDLPWSHAMHQLKGSSAGVGAVCLSTLCAEAEVMSDSSLDKREEMFVKIKQTYEKTKEVMQSIYS